MIATDLHATNGYSGCPPACDGLDTTSAIKWIDNARAAILGVGLTHAKLMEHSGTAGENDVLEVDEFHEIMRLLVDAASDRVNDVKSCVYKIIGVSSCKADTKYYRQKQDPSADLALKILLGVQKLVNSLDVRMTSEGDRPAKEALAAISVDAQAILEDARKLDRLLDRAQWRGVTDGHGGPHDCQGRNGSTRDGGQPAGDGHRPD